MFFIFVFLFPITRKISILGKHCDFKPKTPYTVRQLAISTTNVKHIAKSLDIKTFKIIVLKYGFTITALKTSALIFYIKYILESWQIFGV